METQISETIRAKEHERDQTPPIEVPMLQVQMVKSFLKLSSWFFPNLGARLSWRLFTTPLYRAKHKQTDELLEAVQRFSVPFKDGQLQGYAWGEEGKPTVLLVHGWESRGTALRSLVPSLLAQGYRIVTFDGPAHGDSPGKQTDLHDFGEGVKAVWGHVGHVKHLVAHSFGCPATVFMLARNPHLALDKMVFASGNSSLTYALGQLKEAIDVPKNIMERVKTLVEKKFSMTIEEMDIAKSADKVNVKNLLVIHDKEDDVVAFERAEEIAASWPNATLIATEGFGHFRLLKSPIVIERIAAFIG